MRQTLRIALVMIFVASGCASSAPEPTSRTLSFRVTVDGYAATEAGGSLAGQSFVIASAVDGGEADLQFQEFARYVRGVLLRRGMVEAPADRADVAVFLEFGIGEPNVAEISRAIPVYRVVPGQVASISMATTSRGETVQSVGSIWVPATRQQIGTEEVRESRVTYLRRFTLDAWDLRRLRTTNEAVPLWKVVARSSGASGDLRRVFPAMLAASAEHIGASTGQRVEVKLTEDDPRVIEVLQR